MSRRTAATFVLCGTMLCAGALWAAGPTVRLTGVPQTLTMPMPAGRNAVVTATVEGAEVVRAWLAKDRDAAARYMLTAVGKGQWQVNLAEPALGAMLAAQGRDGHFRVFAEAPDGKVYASVPVRFSAQAPAPKQPPTFKVVIDGRTRTLLAGAALEGVNRWDLRDMQQQYLCPAWTTGEGWYGGYPTFDRFFVPAEEVSRIEVQFAPGDPLGMAKARIGEKRFDFKPVEGKNTVALDVTDAMRKAWDESGTLSLGCDWGGEGAVGLTLKAVPTQLDLKEPTEFTVIQRSSKDVPGSGGYLQVHADDISATDTFLSLKTADGRTLIDQKVVHRGDVLPFTLGKTKYELKVDQLTTHIFNEDYATLTVAPAGKIKDVDAAAAREAAERRKINRLIDYVAGCDIVLIRGDKEYTHAEASRHLRAKYDAVKDEIKTLDDFIDKVASGSWITGKDYTIRLPGGTEYKANEWLHKECKRLFKEEKGEKGRPAAREIRNKFEARNAKRRRGQWPGGHFCRPSRQGPGHLSGSEVHGNKHINMS